ncbi:hypothetical protein JXA40_10220 [bacterium]|nr:hypothetical protein [candidate division CSSED10-310 bacterium]
MNQRRFLFVLVIAAMLDFAAVTRPAAASIYKWRDDNRIMHITNVKPEWWTEDMDQMDFEDIHPPSGFGAYPLRFIGDKENKKVHDPSCDQIYTPDNKMAIPDQKVIWFESLGEAVKMGYRQCDHCRPGQRRNE